MNLDDSQRKVVDITSDSRQVVIAGPGAGKTEVVAALVDHLVNERSLDADVAVVVLSFSNAAVVAVEARLRESGTDPITVQTIDSLASEALRDLAEVEIEGLGFDQRIELATNLIADEGWERLERIEHLIIDEVQDVVGVRADFLSQVIGSLPAESGFTALGDPAQGIYDFQIVPESSGGPARSTTSSQEFIGELVESNRATERVLVGQYRARSRDALAAASLRQAVLTSEGSSAVERFVAQTPRVGEITEVVGVAARWPGRTAFLTENNGQALLVAGEIARAGASVELRRGADQRVLAAWIALLLSDVPTRSISRAGFDDLVLGLGLGLDTHRTWLGLRKLSGGRGAEIDVAKLAARLTFRNTVPPDFQDKPDATFVVSTVHRAKGLEFDNVVLIDFPSKPWIAPGEPADECRRRFVALTRAKSLILRSTGPDDRSLRRVFQGGPSRWFDSGRAGWQTFGVELGVEDFDRTRPGGTDLAAAQVHLRQGVQIGDPIEFRLDSIRSSLEVPIYEVLHHGMAIARTSVGFGESLARQIGTRELKRAPWPGLSGARLESVGTVPGEPQAGPVGRHGLWLAPFAAGMLKVNWKGNDYVEA